jgi:hypothetical protein
MALPFQMKNKVFVIKVMDDPELNKPKPPPQSHAQAVAARNSIVEQEKEIITPIFMGFGALILTYVGADTIRQVAVIAAKSVLK